jgi:hypothetical protein
VFPPPLPASQDFNFHSTAKPHVQFRPVEPGVFDEHDEELSAIANQVPPNDILHLLWGRVSDAERDVIVGKLLDPIFDISPVFVLRWEMQIYLRGIFLA